MVTGAIYFFPFGRAIGFAGLADFAADFDGADGGAAVFLAGALRTAPALVAGRAAFSEFGM
jgi:hypothetical protein